MSSFLIVPRNVYGQLKCCTASGISDPVPAPDTPDNPFGTNYVAQNLGTPYNWQISGAIGDIGAVAFGVCCGTKEVSVVITVAVDFSGVELCNVDAQVDTSVGVPTLIQFSVTPLPDESGNYEIVVIVSSSITPPEVVYTEITQDPGEVSWAITQSGSVTATACLGEIFASSTLFETTPIVPATVTAQFSIT
jgi:hypothetical protein